AKVLHGEVWRLVTYAFLHDTQTPWHILFNMLFLWWFGSDVEDLYGPREFTAFYLVSAVFGGVVHVLLDALGWHQGVQVPGPPGELVRLLPPVVGASGAVTTVMVLCAIHFPTRVILFWFFPIPIWLFVIGKVFLDFYSFLNHSYGGTAVDV